MNLTKAQLAELRTKRTNFYCEYKVEAAVAGGYDTRHLFAHHFSDLQIIFQKRLGNPDFRTALVYFFVEDYTDPNAPKRIFSYHNIELDPDNSSTAGGG